MLFLSQNLLLQYMLKFDQRSYADDSDEISVETDDEASDADQPPQQPSSTDVQAPAKSQLKKFGKSQTLNAHGLLEHQTIQPMLMKLKTSTVKGNGFKPAYTSLIYFSLRGVAGRGFQGSGPP